MARSEIRVRVKFDFALIGRLERKGNALVERLGRDAEVGELQRAAIVGNDERHLQLLVQVGRIVLAPVRQELPQRQEKTGAAAAKNEREWPEGDKLEPAMQQ
jgi:hypothetical protein